MTVGGSAGAAHLAGQTIRGLRIVQRLEGTPWRWLCQCTVCRTQQVQRHDVLMTGYPKCFNSPNCGRKQQTADEWFAAAKKEERRQEIERQKQLQEQSDRAARLDAEKKARADAVAAKKAQVAAEAERTKAVQQARGRHALAELERQAIFDKYQLSDAEIREVMNDNSVRAEDFDDPEQSHFHFLALQISERKAQQGRKQ